jgi:hypothetical protein
LDSANFDICVTCPFQGHCVVACPEAIASGNALLDVDSIVKSSRLEALKLTPRQQQVLGLLRQGEAPTEISRALNISLWTVYRHLQEIRAKLSKLGVSPIDSRRRRDEPLDAPDRYAIVCPHCNTVARYPRVNSGAECKFCFRFIQKRTGKVYKLK